MLLLKWLEGEVSGEVAWLPEWILDVTSPTTLKHRVVFPRKEWVGLPDAFREWVMRLR